MLGCPAKFSSVLPLCASLVPATTPAKPVTRNLLDTANDRPLSAPVLLSSSREQTFTWIYSLADRLLRSSENIYPLPVVAKDRSPPGRGTSMPEASAAAGGRTTA